MKEFFTREPCNTGRKVILPLPSGKPSTHWVHILGGYSDTFRKAERESLRRVASIASENPDDPSANDELYEMEKVKLVACLVTDWSFEEECTQENVVNFLVNAPQIMDFLNSEAVKLNDFFEPGLANSETTPNGPSI